MTATRPYQMRTMPSALLDRVRILAAYEDTTMERIVVAALTLGLRALEAESRQQRRSRHAS